MTKIALIICLSDFEMLSEVGEVGDKGKGMKKYRLVATKQSRGSEARHKEATVNNIVITIYSINEATT